MQSRVARSAARARVLGALMIVAGVAALIAVPAIDLPGRASSGRLILREFSTTMSPRGLAALNANFAMIDAFGTQFVTQTLPGLQHDLKLSRAELDSLLATRFPAVWRGVQEIPPALTLVRPVVPRIEAMAGRLPCRHPHPGPGAAAALRHVAGAAAGRRPGGGWPRLRAAPGTVDASGPRRRWAR